MSSAHLTEYVTIQKSAHQTPMLKGPFRPTEIEAFVREAIAAYPLAIVNVISVHGSARIDVESGRECLAVFDADDSRKNSRTETEDRAKAMALRWNSGRGLPPSKL